MAAEANHPEGLYNLGVLHENGLAGLPVNRDLALDYFQRAADHPRPFDMAVHAMGSNHLRGFNGVSGHHGVIFKLLTNNVFC